MDDEVPSQMWRSSNRFGTVRAVVVANGVAIVLDDLISDEREVELSAYRVSADGWWWFVRESKDDGATVAIRPW